MQKFDIKNKKILTQGNIFKLSILASVLIFAIIASLNVSMSDVQTYIKQNQSQSILISFIVYVLLGFTFLPSLPLTLFIALLIGPLQAGVVATLGNTISAFFEYQLGKAIGDVVHFEEKKAKLPFGLGELPTSSPYFLMAVRSIPAGTRSVSIMCGAFHVPISTYLLTTFTMYLFSSFFIAYGGAQIFNLF